MLQKTLFSYVTDKSKVKGMDKKQAELTAKDFLSKAVMRLRDVGEKELSYRILECMQEFTFIECVYIFNKEGIQISDTIMNPNVIFSDYDNFHPADHGADCSKKKYYVRTIHHPEQVYSSYEYVSSATNQLCSTYACFYQTADGKKYILCADME